MVNNIRLCNRPVHVTCCSAYDACEYQNSGVNGTFKIKY